MKIIKIDVGKLEGVIPEGYDLVEYEKGGDPADGFVLYGLDEVGMFAHNPVHALVEVQ